MILKPRPFRKPRLGLPICRGLVGLWIFNEGSGNKVFDLSGNGYSMDFVNSPVWSSGKYGACILLDDASTQYIYKESAPITSTPFTMIGWFNADDGATNGAIFWLGNKDSVRDYWILYAGGGTAGDPVKAIVRSLIGEKQDILLTTTGFTVGKWHQAALVCESDTVRKVYIDAGSVGNGDASSISPAGTNRIGSGYWLDKSPDNPFSGKIGCLLLYNRALTHSEIVQLYREPFCMFEREPIELWSAAMLGGAPPANAMPMAMDYYRRLRVA